MFGSLPQPSHMPCEECGVSVHVGQRDWHACDEERRLDYRMFQLSGEIAEFDDSLRGYLSSLRGRFEVWYAERERRRAA